MSYIRIPLLFGNLRVKKASQMRRDEWHRQVPVWRVGQMCIVWRPRRRHKDAAPNVRP